MTNILYGTVTFLFSDIVGSTLVLATWLIRPRLRGEIDRGPCHIVLRICLGKMLLISS